MSDPQTQPQTTEDEPASKFDEAYPDELRKRERRLLEKRHTGIELPWDPDRNPERLIGVGLSGGGIRIATFALGLFQGMAKTTKKRKKGLLRYIDFLSTVSGGGYFGSFFGRLLTRSYVQTPDDVDEILLGTKQKEVFGFLRENGRYLAPNGAGDSLLAGAAVLRNWISIHLVLGLFVLAVFLGLQTLRGAFGPALEFSQKADALLWLSPLLLLPLVSFVLAAIPIGWAYWLVEPERKKIIEGAGSANAAQEVSAIPPVAALALVFVVSVSLAIVTREQPIVWLWVLLAAVTALAFGFWKLAQWRGFLRDWRSMEEEQSRTQKMRQALYRDKAVRNRLGIWVTWALVVTALLLALALVDSIGKSLYAVLKGHSTLGAWLAGMFGSIGVLAGFSNRIAMFFSKGPQGGRPSVPLTLIAGLAAVLIILLILVTLNAGSHAIAFGGDAPKGAPHRLLEVKKEQRSYALKVGPGAAASVAALEMRLCLESAEDCKEPEAITQVDRDVLRTFLGFAAALLLSILFGQTWPFVNRSSLLALYAARLTRAYLGASNKDRWYGRNITEPVEGDDSDLPRYWPPPSPNGAPIHLINVTINETIDAHSQVQQQDRKGLGLALGPWGLSAGVKHHLVVPLGDEIKMKDPEEGPIFGIYPKSGFRVFAYPKDAPQRFTGEALPLGTWLSISGAAFSTGTGFRTSLGLSFLAGFGNVRLGRWWDSGITPEQRVKDSQERDPTAEPTPRKISLRIEDTFARLFPVQTYLLDEFLARFPGTARRHWYLSDGGHFENMGGYELLRRRLRFIVIVDGEMDADSTFEGLANLVRKARIDFEAEVQFLSEEQLDDALDVEVRPYVGTLEQLRRGTWESEEKKRDKKQKGPHGHLVKPEQTGRALAHAALARVTYANSQAVSWLLYIKPTLTGREPVDLLEYHANHPNFPHEPTIDQFFDEAQWESYRRLGEYIADVLFGELESLLPEDGNFLKSWSWAPDVERDKKEGRLRSYS